MAAKVHSENFLWVKKIEIRSYVWVKSHKYGLWFLNYHHATLFVKSLDFIAKNIGYVLAQVWSWIDHELISG